MYVSMYISMYVFMYVCMYGCMYVTTEHGTGRNKSAVAQQDTTDKNAQYNAELRTIISGLSTSLTDGNQTTSWILS